MSLGGAGLPENPTFICIASSEVECPGETGNSHLNRAIVHLLCRYDHSLLKRAMKAVSQSSKEKDEKSRKSRMRIFNEEAGSVRHVGNCLIAPILIFLALVCFAGYVDASNPRILRIEQGEGFAETEDSIVFVGNEPFVMMRSLAAGFGGNLTWIEPTKESVFTTDRVVAVFKAGHQSAHINGQAVELSASPDLSTGRMAISINDLDLIGLKASVDYEAGVITVSYQRSSVSSASWSVEDGRVTIAVEADYGFEYSDFVLVQPDRVVVDIHDSVLSPSFETCDISYGAVECVRAAMNRPGVVRVVVDLRAPLGYTVSLEPGPPARLTISFNVRISEMLIDPGINIPRLTVRGDGPISCSALAKDENGFWHADICGATIAEGLADITEEIGAVDWVKASQLDVGTARIEFGLKEGYSPILHPREADLSQLVFDIALTVLGIETYDEPGCTVTKITTSGPVEFKSFRLPGPERVGIDLPGVWAGGYGSLPVRSTGVQQVRFAQFTADTGRVVLDLSPQAARWAHSVEIFADKMGVIVRVGSSPIYGRTVMLDPGHGGSDPGTVHGDIYEKDINLDIALRTRDLLLEAGAVVQMTREDDSTVRPADRPAMANEAKPDVFLSIHCNSVLNVFPCGTETYYYNMVSYSQELATQVHSCLLKEIMLVDRKVRRKDYYVLRVTEVPAVLVEVGYLSNEEENGKLCQPEFRQKAAQGLVNGISAYFDSDIFTEWWQEAKSR